MGYEINSNEISFVMPKLGKERDGMLKYLKNNFPIMVNPPQGMKLR